jgi:hypothetical protein
MAILAIAPVHGARVRCNRSRADTALQGCVVPVRVRMCVGRRGWCPGYGLDLSQCGNDHGGASVCTVASMEGGVQRDVDHLGLVVAGCRCGGELKQ